MKKQECLKKILFITIICLAIMPNLIYEAFASVSGEISNNIHKHNYTLFANGKKSYLYENSAGEFVRVEYIDHKVRFERYTKDGEYIDLLTEITPPLPYFGCFYNGEKYNYLCFGETNDEHDDGKSVIIVQKYSKDMKLIEESTANKINTALPFNVGIPRMIEEQGILYVYTDREMYNGHQSNLELIFNAEPLEFLFQTQESYCSHSMNQFIKTDGEYMYTLDHGDANPRWVVMTRFPTGTSSFTAHGRGIVRITGETGNNDTGLSVGGFELAGDNAYIAGNSILQEDGADLVNGQRNIFLSIAKKDLSGYEQIWYTNYEKNDGISPNTPYLIKQDDNNFIIMWEEYNSSKKYTTKIIKIDDAGNILNSTECNASLSECEPVIASDNKIYWYVTNNTEPIFYSLDPETLKTNTDPMEFWNYNTATDTLYIGGSGSIPGGSEVPWYIYKDKAKHLILRSGITQIEESAFADYSALEDVKISNTVASIGNSAFSGCTSLVSAELPRALTSLPDYLFNGCTSLKSLDIPIGAEKIGSYVFENCISLESIDVPQNVTSIGNSSFKNCTALKTAKLNGAVYDINPSLFENCSALESVSLGQARRYINNYAFRGCSSLKSIDIPNNITRISTYAFSNCISLEKVILPDTLNSLDMDSFSNCSSLKEIEIPALVTSLPSSVFQNCTALEKVVLKGDVTEINTRAFSGCSSLSDISLPESLKSIGSSAFSDCTSLKSISIPDNLNSIGSYAFRNCISLKSIILPYGLSNIPLYSFENCSSLESAVIPDSVTEIEGYAFANCSSLKYVNLPQNLQTMGGSIFRSCTALESITLPDTLPAIGSRMFESSGLTSISIPGSVKTIGTYAFKNCNIETIILPEGVETIESSAFDSNGIKYIIIPDSVENVYISIIFNKKCYCRKGSAFDIKYSSYQSYYGYIGDVNNDRSINSYDAGLILKYVCNSTDISDTDKKIRADWDKDTTISILDSIGVLKDAA